MGFSLCKLCQEWWKLLHFAQINEEVSSAFVSPQEKSLRQSFRNQFRWVFLQRFLSQQVVSGQLFGYDPTCPSLLFAWDRKQRTHCGASGRIGNERRCGPFIRHLFRGALVVRSNCTKLAGKRVSWARRIRAHCNFIQFSQNRCGIHHEVQVPSAQLLQSASIPLQRTISQVPSQSQEGIGAREHNHWRFRLEGIYPTLDKGGG